MHDQVVVDTPVRPHHTKLQMLLYENELYEKERKDLEGSRVEGTFHINLFMLH
jgi:hypothetical protein